MKNKTAKIEISHRTIIFTVVFLLMLYLIYLIKDVLLLLFIAFLLTTAINPLVTKLEKHKISRSLSIPVVYLLMLTGIISAIAGIVPPLVSQTAKLISQIPIPPEISENIKNLNINLQDLNVIASQLNSIPKVFELIGSAFTVVAVILTVMVMSFYLLKERRYLHKNLVWIFGENKTEKEAEDFVNRIEEQIGGWVRGEFLLMLIVGILTFLGLKLLNVSFAVPLAIIAGLFEVLPNIGPTLSAIPAIIIAFLTASPTMALAVTALYVLVQQLENNFIVPYIMRKAAGMNPIVTIVTVLVGFRLGGVGGAALSIPAFLVLKVSLQEYIKIKKI
ncbi:AI-2E family transporter [Patescibacteria group bacterium]